MNRRQPNPRVLRLLMQGALVAVLLATVGLAVLVTRYIRLSMRVELAPPQTFARLTVRLPARWAASPVTVERGDAVEAEEPPGDQPGRRLRIVRQRAADLVSPLEHLHRSGRLKADALRALLDGRDGYSRQNLTVAGWPGQMITLQTWARGGAVHKDIIACAVTGSAQAIVIQLEGAGLVDASDRELVRQIAENVSIAMQGGPGEPGATVTLTDDIRIVAPSHYLLVPNDDPNTLQRQLLFDGSWGGAWVAVDLVSCIHFPGDPDDALLALLAARDPDWRQATVQRIGPRTLIAQRSDALAAHFPARACLLANPDGRALLVILRAGLGDGRIFDSLWPAIASSIRFEGTRDFFTLLDNGSAAARALAQRGVTAGAGTQQWMIWDQAENADQEMWSQCRWHTDEAGEITGSRTTLPVDPYASETQHEQQWSLEPDLSKYQIATFRDTRRPGNTFPRQTLEQRAILENARLNLQMGVPGPQADLAAPPQYVPGAILPLVLCDLAQRPCLIKTESFAGPDTLTASGLLLLFITRLADAPLRRDEKDQPMQCVTVSVNGSGKVSRWYYTPDGDLRFIDFASNLKAQQVTR